jgi:hypothetical protein
VLCKADSNLLPSEQPASTLGVVTNRFLRRFGSAECTAEGLREQTTGNNFRTAAVDLAVQSDRRVFCASVSVQSKRAVTMSSPVAQ